MREHAPEFHVSETLLTHEAPKNAYAIVRRLIVEEPELRGIFVNGGGIPASCGPCAISLWSIAKSGSSAATSGPRHARD